MNTLLAILLTLISGGMYDNTFPPLGLSGWLLVENEAAWYGSYHETSSAGMTFDIIGDGLTIYGVRMSGAGTASVCVDAVCVTTVSWDAPILVPAEIVNISSLGNGIHTVTITPDGNGAVNIDAIYIHPERPATPQPEMTAEPTPAHIVYTSDERDVQFVNSANLGDVAIVVLLTVLIVMVGFSMVWMMFQREER